MPEKPTRGREASEREEDEEEGKRAAYVLTRTGSVKKYFSSG